MKSFRTCLLALALSSSLTAAPIVLFNTGVDGSGVVLPGGSSDGHYQILTTPSVAAKVITTPAGTWLPPSASSAWIWLNANGTPINTTYTFRTTFDLAGLDPSTALITGRWSTDNAGLDILINGQSTGQTTGTFSQWAGFSIGTTHLLPGVNTLDFVVKDLGVIAGFRAEFLEARADVLSANVPDGGSVLTLLGGVLMVCSMARRRVHSGIKK